MIPASVKVRIIDMLIVGPSMKEEEESYLNVSLTVISKQVSNLVFYA